jgi:hypothetical protein
VIVHDLNVLGTGCRPAEAGAVLVVDAHAVLACATVSMPCSRPTRAPPASFSVSPSLNETIIPK